MKKVKEQKFSTFKRIFTLQVNNVLLSLGYKTKFYIDEFYEIYFQDDVITGRVIIDERIIQLGYKTKFDRWANSVDLVINIPDTLEKLSNLINEIKQNGYKLTDTVKVSKFTSTWGS